MLDIYAFFFFNVISIFKVPCHQIKIINVQPVQLWILPEAGSPELCGESGLGESGLVALVRRLGAGLKVWNVSCNSGIRM